MMDIKVTKEKNISTFSQDVHMKFGMDKYKMLTMQQGRMKHLDRLKLHDGELMKETDTAAYKYLVILQDDQIRYRVMKEKMEEEYLKRVKKQVKSKLYSKNMIGRINA